MKEIAISEFHCNPFTLIGKEWCLIGAESENGFNAMTASWGGLGVIWNKNVVTIYVRPQRYTNEFIERSDTFTLSFFEECYRPALQVYGSKSGRDIDKEKETGLTLVKEKDITYFREAKLVIVCKKQYCGAIKKEGFVFESVEKQHYPQEDYHIVYIGEIIKILEG